MGKTIAIIGGTQEQTFKKVGKKAGCQVLFHNGLSGSKKEFGPLINKADGVVILLGACGHRTMDIVKGLCKENNVKLAFQQGFGASGAISKGLTMLSETA